MCSVQGVGVGRLALLSVCVLGVGGHTLAVSVSWAAEEILGGEEKHVKQMRESSELCFPFCLHCPRLFPKVCLNLEARTIF